MTTPVESRSRALAQGNVGEWVLDETSDPKFPFRLRIYTHKRTEPVVSFFVQDRWPGSNQHIFCLCEVPFGEDVAIGAEIERIPVVARNAMAVGSAWSSTAHARSAAISRLSRSRTRQRLP